MPHNKSLIIFLVEFKKNDLETIIVINQPFRSFHENIFQ